MLNIQDLKIGDIVKYQITYKSFQIEEVGKVIGIDRHSQYVNFLLFAGGRGRYIGYPDTYYQIGSSEHRAVFSEN